MENDVLVLIKQNGERLEGIKAIVTNKGVRIIRDDIHFEIGDELERLLPNGHIERLVITRVTFNRGLHNIPNTYSLEVREKGRSEPQRQPHTVTYNLNGPNSRVNIHSQDHSKNVVGLDAEDIFSKLEAAILAGVENQERQKEILAAVEAMRESQGKPAFISRYTEFMGVLADHITVVVAFLPVLAQMLPVLPQT